MVGGFSKASLAARPAGSVKLLLIGWFVSEILAFALVVKVLGFGGAILLTALSSGLGVVLLRRLGLDAAQHVRRAVAGGVPGEGVLLDGTLAGLGAILLVVPGFVTDLIGLALAAPSVRQALLARFGASTPSPRSQARRPPPPGVIDLAPDDWTVVEPPRPR